MKKNNRRLLSYLLPAVLAIVGGAAGYLYYRYVGCITGVCAITSNPYISTIFGGVFGLLIGFIFTPDKRKREGGQEGDR